MAELLLELLSEEIPARMQARAAADLKRLVTDALKDAGLDFDRAEAFATPRRLALVVDGLPGKQPDVTEERKGPQVGAPDKAIEGFLGSVGLALDQCEKREIRGKEFWFAVLDRRGRPTPEVLAESLPNVLAKFPWPKSMRWGAGETRWVRPLHSILCLFGGTVVPFAFAGIDAGDETRGHRFMAPDPVRATGFADYREKLRSAYVMLDPAEREEALRADAARLAEEEGLRLRDDPALAAEVAGLVEWPVALIGAIDAAFMEVPPEVLTESMRAHQKYFAVERPDGTLAPRFVVVANVLTDDGGAQVVAGNERVLRARLADARFFWDQDRKDKLESRVEKLDGVVFHERVGSLGEKVGRIMALSAELCRFIPGADRDFVRIAAHLCKADLTTSMVGEFPELQGVMGRYYALHDGERPEVADAIAEHYSPKGPSDTCPTAPTSVAVALADRIDTLVALFGIGERPTGSRDPFALRRAALGVIRLIVENNLRVPLVEAFKKAEYEVHMPVVAEITEEDRGEFDTDELLAFFADRLKVQMREKGVRHDLIEAVFATPRPDGGTEDDLVRLLARVDALAAFLGTEDGADLLTAYKRAVNIVRIEEKKDKASHDGPVDEALLEAPEEKRLNEVLDLEEKALALTLAEEKFVDAMSALAELRQPVDAFFDRVTVNCEDAALRANRLRLLSRIRAALNRVADFSRIEG